MKYATPGTISHGTMLPDDLLPKFARELEDCVTRNPELPLIEREQLTKLVWEAREFTEFESDASAEMIFALMDALQDFAPPGHYFGSHEGDGADFGYWPEEAP
jgi:hypothetical protein